MSPDVMFWIGEGLTVLTVVMCELFDRLHIRYSNRLALVPWFVFLIGCALILAACYAEMTK